MGRKSFVLFMLLLGSFVVGMGKAPSEEIVARMSVEELKTRLTAPDLVVIDVRYGKDWTESDRKIAGAVREDPASPEQWASRYPKEKTLVLYCA